jgi:cytochrome P450
VFHQPLFDVRSPVLQHGSINFAEAASSGIGLIIAGNDTSGLGVSALLATLPLFPEVVQKLRQEQQQVTCLKQQRHVVAPSAACHTADVPEL